jgi:DNA-binding phage protein
MKSSSADISFDTWMIEKLQADRELAVECLIAAMESLDNPEERDGGLGAVAEQAGISRESLYRALSPRGNPTLKTLIAVLKTLGLRLSVTPEKQVRRRRKKAEGDCAAA